MSENTKKDERFTAGAHETDCILRGIRTASKRVLEACGHLHNNQMAVYDLTAAIEKLAHVAGFLCSTLHRKADGFDAPAEAANEALRAAQAALGHCEDARGRAFRSTPQALLRKAERLIKLAITFLAVDSSFGASRRRTDAPGKFKVPDILRLGGRGALRPHNYRHPVHHAHACE